MLLLREPIALRARDRLDDRARSCSTDTLDPAAVDAVLLDVNAERARRVRARVRRGRRARSCRSSSPDADGGYDWARLVVERTVTVNTAAAGGNAALLSLSEDAA